MTSRPSSAHRRLADAGALRAARYTLGRHGAGRPIAILGGTGDQGLGLALRFARAGRRVVIGSRKARARASRPREQVRKQVPGRRVEGLENADAAARAPIVILSVPVRAHGRHGEGDARAARAGADRGLDGRAARHRDRRRRRAHARRLAGIVRGAGRRRSCRRACTSCRRSRTCRRTGCSISTSPVECDVVVSGAKEPRERVMALCELVPGPARDRRRPARQRAHRRVDHGAADRPQHPLQGLRRASASASPGCPPRLARAAGASALRFQALAGPRPRRLRERAARRGDRDRRRESPCTLKQLCWARPRTPPHFVDFCLTRSGGQEYTGRSGMRHVLLAAWGGSINRRSAEGSERVSGWRTCLPLGGPGRSGASLISGNRPGLACRTTIGAVEARPPSARLVGHAGGRTAIGHVLVGARCPLRAAERLEQTSTKRHRAGSGIVSSHRDDHRASGRKARANLARRRRRAASQRAVRRNVPERRLGRRATSRAPARIRSTPSSGSCAPRRSRTSSGEVVFEQTDVEVPKSWSQLATNVVVSKYFRGHVGTPEREHSVKQLIGRVVGKLREWGDASGYFATPDDCAGLLRRADARSC